MQTISAPTFTTTQRVQTSLKIIALGDSLVYGFGDPVGGGWIERLRRQWMAEESGHILYNLGIRGDRVAQVSERLEQEFRHRGELRNKVPDLIILSVGVNDSARLGRLDGRSFTEFALYKEQITNLLVRSRQLCPVLFVGMVPVNEEKMPFLDCLYFNHKDQYRYKEFTKQACKSLEIPYLDIFDRWMEKGDDWMRSRLSSDGLHPNPQGYESLLEDILAWKPIAQLNY
ncbi:MAG: GDSL-type esterase/lipase family protein [Hydrococcus sp. Prado102]|jgi:lysophospholipase L1-like esterase|nr:GDSL-type esterase/lipase family protein [Hydrococcus sp. Prado102]